MPELTCCWLRVEIRNIGAAVGGDLGRHHVLAFAGLADDVEHGVLRDAALGEMPVLVGVHHALGGALAVVERILRPHDLWNIVTGSSFAPSGRTRRTPQLSWR